MLVVVYRNGFLAHLAMKPNSPKKNMQMLQLPSPSYNTLRKVFPPDRAHGYRYRQVGTLCAVVCDKRVFHSGQDGRRSCCNYTILYNARRLVRRPCVRGQTSPRRKEIKHCTIIISLHSNVVPSAIDLRIEVYFPFCNTYSRQVPTVKRAVVSSSISD